MGTVLVLFCVVGFIALVLKYNGISNPFDDKSIDKFVSENPDSKISKLLKD